MTVVGVCTCSVAARCLGGAGPAQSEGCGPGCSERKADSGVLTPTACWPEDLLSDASHPAPAFQTRKKKEKRGGHEILKKQPRKITTAQTNEEQVFEMAAQYVSYRTRASGLPSWLLGMQFSTGSFWLFPAPFCFFSFLLVEEPGGTLPFEEL